MQAVPLNEICEITMGQAPSGLSYNENGKGYALLAGAGDFGELTPEPKKYTTEAGKISKQGDLILCIRATIGDLNWSDKEYCLGRGVAGLRPIKNKLDSTYLWYFIKANKVELSSKGTGSTFKQVNSTHIKEWKIPLPPLTEQKRIATILDKADAIRRKRQQAIQLADEFLRSVFLDMFGDPVTNPKGWEIKSLAEFGSFKNGLNFRKGEAGHNLQYLGVGDFKALATIDDFEGLSSISLDSIPTEDYLLQDGDLVFVRSNGNKALVGRCISVYPGNIDATFSGFCIRYRIEKTMLLTEYLVHLFRTPSMKSKMLQGGQGANIQNINQKILSSLKIPVPPMEAQEKFSKMLRKIDKMVVCFEGGKNSTTELFKSTSQKAFVGEL